MNFLHRTIQVALVLSFFQLKVHAVTIIERADFEDSRTLDFEAIPSGPISGMFAAFLDIGISSVVPESPDLRSPDPYDHVRQYGAALATNSAGLFIIRPDEGFLNSSAYLISTHITDAIGFTFADSDQPGSIIFSRNGIPVDSSNFVASGFMGFRSNVPFDHVRIDVDSDAFGLGEITLDAEIGGDDFAKIIKRLPKEKRADFLKRRQRLQPEKRDRRLEKDYETGTIPKDGHKVIGTWRDKSKKRKYVFKADGTFENIWFHNARSGTWRIAPGGSIILRSPTGYLQWCSISTDGLMTFIDYDMDCGPTIFKKSWDKIGCEQGDGNQTPTAVDQ